MKRFHMNLTVGDLDQSIVDQANLTCCYARSEAGARTAGGSAATPQSTACC